MRFWLSWGLGLLVWTVAMFVGGQFDLRLSLLMIDSEAPIAQLVARYGEWPGWLAVIGAVAVLGLARRRRRDGGLAALRPLAWSVIALALCHPLAATQTLKYLWGRVRFHHLGADLADYTPFWVPAGIGAGRSFPSGHVAMSMVPAPLPFFLLSARRDLAAAAGSGVAVLLVGVTVSLGRIVGGKHYLTDTLFSVGLALLLAPLLLRWLRRRPAG